MRTNVIGRVRNMNLPKSQGLLPLFEAVINSIDAIDESGKQPNEGRIDIYINRIPDLYTEIENETNEPLQPVSGFKIVDNGIGFTRKNYDSFNEADTLNKASRGGKGVGRFTWLRAFEKVELHSNFFEENSTFSRSFDFQLEDPDCIKNHNLEQSKDNLEIKTEVSLINYKEEFAKNIPRTGRVIAQRVVEYCLEYYVFSLMPHCFIHDSMSDVINLDDLYDQFVAKSDREELEINSHKFDLFHFFLHTSHDLKHHICFCANNRVVLPESINTRIYNLPSTIKIDDTNDDYCYAGYLSSPYLDSKINPQRTNFEFPEDMGYPIQGELSKKEIEEKVINSISKYLEPYTELVNKDKISKIEEIVKEQAPQFRYILEHHKERLEKISPDLPPNKLELELYEIEKNIELDLKKEGDYLLRSDDTVFSENSTDEILERFSKWWQDSNDVGKANLAKYIILRKNTLEVMEKALSTTEKGKYSKEEVLHRIIFPLRKTSDDIFFEQHNLWLIDEKLAYHRYLASDIKLNQNRKIQSTSDSRPDLILFFDRAIAVVNEEAPYSAGIVIFEFKRPMRNDYSDKENPIQQVYDYIDEIQKGKELTKDGRPININPSTPFYGYIICDITETLRKQAFSAGLVVTPDNNGFFGFNPNYRAYVEVISFEKMLLDSKKRNRVLFEKLNLPTLY